MNDLHKGMNDINTSATVSNAFPMNKSFSIKLQSNREDIVKQAY